MTTDLIGLSAEEMAREVEAMGENPSRETTVALDS